MNLPLLVLQCSGTYLQAAIAACQYNIASGIVQLLAGYYRNVSVIDLVIEKMPVSISLAVFADSTT